MKASIHPPYVKAIVTCVCGHTFETRSVKSVLNVEICSACHPFFTGKQKLVDTAGRIEKFQRRYGKKAAQSMRESGTQDPAESAVRENVAAEG